MPANFIERIGIKELWGRYNIDWQLNEDVNILIGENGSGKSTVLQTISTMLHHLSDENSDTKFPNDGSVLGKTNIVFKTPVTSTIINSWRKHTFQDGTTIKHRIIDTFDVFIQLDSFKQQDKSYLKTYLDKELEEIINQYVEYQLTINQRLQKLFFSNDKIDVAKKREEIFGKQRYFINTVNRLFQATGKVYNEEVNKIEFKIDDTTITPYQLSSGEKQLLIILLTALVQDGQPFIFLLDEPEISLHLDWQEQLIEIIRTLNPNCQLIIVTHSPGIMMDGWLDKVTEMKNIVHPTNLVPAK